MFNVLVTKILLSVYIVDKNNALLVANTHSNNSKIAEKIKKNLIFWITNLIKTVVVDIISKSNSFIKLLLEAEPLIVTQNTIPKSINKLTGIVSIKNINKNNPPIAQIKILFWITIKRIDVKINKLIVKINKIAKKK